MNTDTNRSSTRIDTQLSTDELSLWIREHKTTAMLGAFAIGVFLGALVRR